MNAIELARQAYAPSSFHLQSERRVEAQVIGKITSRLRAAAEKKKDNFSTFAEALHENRKLWTALAIDATGQGNGLPDQLRAQIVYLAEFTNQHSSKILKGEEDVTALIDINKSIMRGLNSERLE